MCPLVIFILNSERSQEAIGFNTIRGWSCFVFFFFSESMKISTILTLVFLQFLVSQFSRIFSSSAGRKCRSNGTSFEKLFTWLRRLRSQKYKKKCKKKNGNDFGKCVFNQLRFFCFLFMTSKTMNQKIEIVTRYGNDYSIRAFYGFKVCQQFLKKT